jgi:hypothetical protein
MHNRLALPFLLAGSVFAASQSTETLRSPDLNQLPKEQFQQLLSKALNGALSGPPRPVHMPIHSVAAANNHCSIPLLESKVEHPERFTMPKLHGTESLDTIAVRPPAPACKDWNKGK